MATDFFKPFDFKPRGWQSECIKKQKRFTVLAVHRRAGKTNLSVNELILKALTTKNSLYAYIAPELKQAKLIAWNILKERCNQLRNIQTPEGVKNACEFRESELIVRFDSGSEIRLFGADNPDSLRGSKLAGAVIDEVAQMPKELWLEIVYPALMDSKGFALFIGTPKGINLFSELFNRGQDPAFSKEWVSLKFTCYQTDALSPSDIEAYRRSVPEEVFKREMLCDFEASADNTLLSLEDVSFATNRIVDDQFNSNTDLYLGIDVARFGSDRSVLIFRRGLVVNEPIVLQGTSLVELSKVVKQQVIEKTPKQIFVDGTGVGGGVVDILDSWGIYVNDINFGHKSFDSQYINRRTEMWCKMAEWVKRGGVLPKNSQLMSELVMPTYDVNEKYQKVLESKKQIRERLGKSPDLADALALTFAEDFPQTEKTDYDLFLDKLGVNNKDTSPFDRFENDCA